MPDPIHFFVHVPKCAGTTVETHFRRTLGPGGFALAPRWKNPLRDVLGNRAALPPEVVAGGKVISGHSLARSMASQFPGRELRESVLLRDPVGWHVSFYNYRLWRAQDRGQPAPPPFDDWMRAQRRNPIARFLLMRYFEVGYPMIYGLSSRDRFRRLESLLAGFHFVGGHERCDEVVAAISRDLGVDDAVEARNVGGGRAIAGAIKTTELSDALRMRIETTHAIDALLHRRWRGRGFAGAPDGAEAAALTLPDDDRALMLRSDGETLWRKKRWR
ncbi:MAG: hypothetical protein ACJA1L_003730 [Paracoccaceae bacterium]|jgi:hypothetical protein